MKPAELPEYPFHEVAEAFPLMVGQDFDSLKRNIREHGQREPIWLYQGRVIDGRNRYLACRELGLPVQVRQWDGNGSLVAFVESLNLHRRHLSESARAVVAAKLKKRFEEEAKARQAEQARRNRPQSDPQKVANLPPLEKSKSRGRAASEMNVSPRSVESASKVLRDGAPALVEAVESGQATVSAAAEVATLPEAEQAAVVAAGPTAIVRRAREVREDRKAQHVEAKRVQGPDAKEGPKPEETEGGAMDLRMRSLDVFKKLRDASNLFTDDEVESLGHVLHANVRKSTISGLRAVIAKLTAWAETLERING